MHAPGASSPTMEPACAKKPRWQETKRNPYIRACSVTYQSLTTRGWGHEHEETPSTQASLCGLHGFFRQRAVELRTQQWVEYGEACVKRPTRRNQGGGGGKD